MNDPFAKDEVKITVLGGGTGSFTLLSSIKVYTKQIAAIVNMADDGGSTGVLRDELGVLPPGDVRQCLVALSDSDKVRDLFDYRFEEGTFNGHSFGNILLTALEKVTGSFSEAVATASEILRVNGMVIPATFDDVRLKMEWPEASLILHGERVIDANFFRHDPRLARLSLTPNPVANPTAIAAIEQADLVVLAPGDLYTSLGPMLVIDGIGEALRRTKAVKFYVANLVTKDGQTTGFTVDEHVKEIERFAGGEFLDYVLYNKQKPTAEIAKRYKKEKAYPTKIDKRTLNKAHYKAVAGNLLGKVGKEHSDSLPVTRSLIRHDGLMVSKMIMDIYNRNHS